MSGSTIDENVLLADALGISVEELQTARDEANQAAIEQAIADLLDPILELHRLIRDRIVAACERTSPDDLAAVARDDLRPRSIEEIAALANPSPFEGVGVITAVEITSALAWKFRCAVISDTSCAAISTFEASSAPDWI